MKKVIIYLSILAGFASCSREDIDLSPTEIRPILFSGSVENSSSAVTRAGESIVEDPKPEAMNGTPDYGTIYIQRTAEEIFAKESFTDMANFQEFMVNVGDLECKEGCWYWNNQKHHLFHAWNLPTTKGTLKDAPVSGEEKPLVTIDESHRFGTVDFSMDKRYSYTIKEEEKDPEYIYFLSNLEYFIGAVAGPLTKTSNGGGEYVTLPFKHLVAKIIVKEIIHIRPDGSPEPRTDEISFYMPNMPNKAYWTTGVPASLPIDDWNSYIPQEPQVTLKKPEGYSELSEKDFGVSGKLRGGDAFYIFPCKFSDQNKITTQPFGQIQFKLNNAWYYGTLESITTVKELKAGECISVTLRMKDGTVKGIYPHIDEWSGPWSGEDITQHDRQGIYNETDWQRLIDWLERWKTNHAEPAPPGLLDEYGNLNLYGNLNVSGLADKYSQSDLITEYLQETNARLKGNDHRIKMKNSGWSADKDCVDELYVSKKTDTGWSTKYYE